MRLCVLVLCLTLCSAYQVPETFRGRLNPHGVNTAELFMRSMIVKVNDLIKLVTRVNDMQIGPVRVEKFRVTELVTPVSFVMGNPINTLGLRVDNGAVHLKATIRALGQAFQFDTYGDAITAELRSGMKPLNGHLHAGPMYCHLNIGHARVDLHHHLINNFANMVLKKLLPTVQNAVCEGVKQFGHGIINGVFEMIPTQVNIFNLFNLHFPLVNFRIWERHIVAGLRMEVRPGNNRQVDQGGLVVRALPEAEDRHFACSAISEYVLNTASRTFFPAGWSITANVATVANLFIKDLFTFAVFARGTIVSPAKLTIENGQIRFTVSVKGVMTTKDGKAIPGAKIKPTTLTVTCPANEKPMFSNVVVKVSGEFNLKFHVNIANIIDMIIKTVNKFAGQQLKKVNKRDLDLLKRELTLIKRATNKDLSKAADRMFFHKWFSGFSMELSARHGAIMVCMSGVPNAAVSSKVLRMIRGSFHG